MCWACGPRARGGPGRSSLPRSADNEGEEGEGQDDDDDEAAAVGAAAVDAALPLIVEFAVGAHGYLKNKIQLTKDVKACPRNAIPLAFDYESGKVG